MTIRWETFTGVGLSLIAGMLMLAAASDSYAGPRGGDSGKLFMPPQNMKLPPSPSVRDHRGGGKATTQTAQGGVLVGGEQGKVTPPKRKCGGCPPSWPYGKDWQKVPKGNLHDHRSK